MDRRDNNLVFFLVFFGLTLFIIIFGKIGIINSTKNIFSDISLKVTSVFNISKAPTGEIAKLTKENADLRKKILDNQNLITENKALRDQFSTPIIQSINLIPAKVVGAPGFIPGITNPDYLVLDKGEKDGIKIGDGVVFQNNFVGKVVKVTNDFSKAEIAISLNSFAAKITGDKEIAGVVKGKGNTLILDNVLLSENLQKNQIVLTKGDMNESGIGIPPDLVVGKIISIEKKSSNLFQRAEIESFVDFKNLSTVFVIKQ